MSTVPAAQSSSVGSKSYSDRKLVLVNLIREPSRSQQRARETARERKNNKNTTRQKQTEKQRQRDKDGRTWTDG